jgi:hypothetical protein
MLYNSPTAELEMKSPTATVVPLTLARYSSTVVADCSSTRFPNLWQNMISSEREQLYESVGKRLPVGRAPH